MIIRNIHGELIQINKYDYANDKIYYEKIMTIMKDFTKDRLSNNNQNKVSSFFSPKNNKKSNSNTMQNICNFINVTPFES
jgi:uncharacterized FlgJ-related protein